MIDEDKPPQSVAELMLHVLAAQSAAHAIHVAFVDEFGVGHQFSQNSAEVVSDLHGALQGALQMFEQDRRDFDT